jgi:hypothetical protein
MESDLKEAPMKNLNYVSAKGDVEFFDNILLQNKRKGVESDFFLGSCNFHLKYRIWGKIIVLGTDDLEENNI